MYNREARRLRRETESSQSDPIASPPTFGAGEGGGTFAGVANSPVAAFANNVDSDSLFGFSANPANFDYRFLGERRMLAPALWTMRSLQPGTWSSRAVTRSRRTLENKPCDSKGLAAVPTSIGASAQCYLARSPTGIITVDVLARILDVSFGCASAEDPIA
ncbi:MAG: hypothetical protein WAU82_03105 [Candidatus Binatus sp.]|uniref:hypothetical protein n=1 Tax=Candidatus Binatus sp. TaxID=2811406 RepID=UPI003BAF15ED